MANPLAVVESGTAQVSVLPDVGSELPTAYVGNGALDVVGLRVGQSCLRMNSRKPCRLCRRSVAIVKVMSVPDNRCVRVLTADDHVNIGFHKVLIHDLEDEDLPFVTLSELGCFRLDWPKTLYTFMSRYKFDLDQMRKDCRACFGSTQSGNCTHCGKHIQQNLGKHIALYHMELAQL